VGPRRHWPAPASAYSADWTPVARQKKSSLDGVIDILSVPSHATGSRVRPHTRLHKSIMHDEQVDGDTGLLIMPDEILLAIIAHVCRRRPRSLAYLARVCSRFSRLCDDDSIWVPIVARMVGAGAHALPSGLSPRTLAYEICSTNVTIAAHSDDYHRPNPLNAIRRRPSSCAPQYDITVRLNRVATPFKLACVAAGAHGACPLYIHLWLMRGIDAFPRLIYAPRASMPVANPQPWWLQMIDHPAHGADASVAHNVSVVVVPCRDHNLTVPRCVGSTLAALAPGDPCPRIRYVLCNSSALAHLSGCSCHTELDHKG
jgi:hypothetical protein